MTEEAELANSALTRKAAALADSGHLKERLGIKETTQPWGLGLSGGTACT